MKRFTVADLSLAGLKCVTRQRLEDTRGHLSRMFCAEEMAAAGFRKSIAQINLTHTTTRGTVRGVHYQLPPYAEMKLVSCLRGEVFDVAVDLRTGSPTFLQWHAEILSAENGRALLIPEGFAHGFQTLSYDCEMLYMHTTSFAPHAEAGLRFDDPRLGITWPLEISDLSDRDQMHPLLNDQFDGFDFV